LSSPSRIGKILTLLALSFTLIPKTNNATSVKGTCEGKFMAPANKLIEVKAEVQNPPILKENTVVFLTISEDDYAALVAKNPALKDAEGLGETVSDFIFYAKKIAGKLKEKGITPLFGQWKELWFQMPDGKIEKRTFNPADFYGLALYAQGKSPMMVRSEGRSDTPNGEKRIDPGFFSMAEVISEYFGVKIEWSEEWASIK
jgi:hypothetical protein